MYKRQVFDGAGVPRDHGPALTENMIPIGGPSFNPAKRILPKNMIRTGIPMIDVFKMCIRDRRQAEMICFSCYIWNLDYVESMIRDVKKVMKDVIIWAGGPEVSYDSRETLGRLPELTGVMKGEGEKTFAKLCKVYGKSSETSELSLEQIDGITDVYKRQVQKHALAGVELIVLNNDSLDIYTAIDNFGQIFLQIFK